jgi:hypothetical protein
MFNVSLLEGVNQLKALLQRKRRNGLVSLSEVPGATVLRVPKPFHNAFKVIDIVHPV